MHSEGEATFAEILDALDAELPDARSTRCGDVCRAHLPERAGGRVVRTEERDRIADLDIIPSPYLLGLLDPFGAAQAGAIIETNRGCPYGCTFCDWGSATLSRIRKFSLDRVFAEFEWVRATRSTSPRSPTRTSASSSATSRSPRRSPTSSARTATRGRVAVNYAKNTVKHLRKIIEIFADVEILTEGVVSLQSMDEPTLTIIRRTNIKLEKYNELSAEFRRARLPLAADIMMGLPGLDPGGVPQRPPAVHRPRRARAGATRPSCCRTAR